jgi:hypothetical protein
VPGVVGVQRARRITAYNAEDRRGRGESKGART